MPSLVEIGQVEEEDFLKFCKCIFLYFVISIWKGAGTSNWNLLHTRMLFAKFGWNWAQWFCRRRFLNFFNVFSLFCNYLHLEKGMVHHLNKIESPSPKNALYQVWLKLAQWFWRRRRKFEKFKTTWPVGLASEINKRPMGHIAHLRKQL